MTTTSGADTNVIEAFPSQNTMPVTRELDRILTMLREVCPKDATISFDFDGRLQAHVDVRRREEVLQLQSVLPGLGGGLFHSLSLGATPHHPFFHRITAVVAS